MATIADCVRAAVLVLAVVSPTLCVPAVVSGSTARTGAPGCETDHLSARLDFRGVAAGTTGYKLLLRNVGTAPCEIGGFPGVSYMRSSHGRQVGAAARWIGARSAVTIAPGHLARATLDIVNPYNQPRATCHLVRVAGLRIYPPDQTEAVFIRATRSLGQNVTCANRSLLQLDVGGF
jgi:hypothetical protein